MFYLNPGRPVVEGIADTGGSRLIQDKGLRPLNATDGPVVLVERKADVVFRIKPPPSPACDQKMAWTSCFRRHRGVASAGSQFVLPLEYSRLPALAST